MKTVISNAINVLLKLILIAITSASRSKSKEKKVRFW